MANSLYIFYLFSELNLRSTQLPGTKQEHVIKTNKTYIHRGKQSERRTGTRSLRSFRLIHSYEAHESGFQYRDAG